MKFPWQGSKAKSPGVTLPISGQVATFHKLSTPDWLRTAEKLSGSEDQYLNQMVLAAAHTFLDGDQAQTSDIMALEIQDYFALLQPLQESPEFKDTQRRIEYMEAH
jgi:hypothetical protein